MPHIDTLYLIGFEKDTGCAGQYDNRQEAEAAAKSVAKYAGSNDGKPKVMTLAEYREHVYRLGVAEGLRRYKM